MQRVISRVLVLALLGSLAGCMVTPNPSPGPQVVTLSAMLPTLTPMSETKELQAKGGIQISVGPVAYQLVRSSVYSDRFVRPSIMQQLTGPKGWQYMHFVERTHGTVLKEEPENLRFRITINNQLSHVFRGAGTVVQFNIGGKLVQVNQAGYADLVNVLVPPRGQQQVEIYGPPIASIPENTTVGLFLYDVVTKTDPAGNATEKQNFVWYFNYAAQLRKETAKIWTEHLWLR